MTKTRKQNVEDNSMDREQVIKDLSKLLFPVDTEELDREFEEGLLEQIIEVVKPYIEDKLEVPQYVIEYYAQGIGNFKYFHEWFDEVDLVSTELGNKVHKWLYDDECGIHENAKRNYAFATLVAKGINSVVVAEKKYMINIPFTEQELKDYVPLVWENGYYKEVE